MEEKDNWNIYSEDGYISKMINKMRTLEEIQITGNDVADMLSMLQVQHLLFYHITSTAVFSGNGESDKANEHLKKVREYLALNGEGIQELHRRFADRMFSRFKDG